jgi:hypothetical protein
VSTTVFVYTMSRTGEVGAWSRYVFPFELDTFCHMGDHLYIRAGDDVLMVDETASQDFQDDERAQPFDGVIQWPWLDAGAPGVSKAIAGFDLVTKNAVNVQLQVGYDQTDQDAFTAAYTIPGDTLPGSFVPMPLLAASFSYRLTLSSFDFWQFQALTVYLTDQRITAQ